MKIESSAINLTAQHYKSEKLEIKENLTFWTGSGTFDSVELSAEARKKLILTGREITSACNEEYPELEVSDEDKLKIKLIESFIESMTGKKIKIHLPKIKIKDPEDMEISFKKQQASTNEPRVGWGLIYDYMKTRQERETMSFAAQGVVKTADGREIKIDLELNMTREFMEHFEVHLRAGDAKKIDPLVVNFAGSLPGLTEEKFSFDLDTDGIPEQISFVKGDSGFLALDLNGDGVINDGTELFGPKSGDGFSELAAYDGDKNNWIDENDSIFSRLRIWTRDAQGNNCLFALGEIGIGAIYLGNVNTLFSLNGQENQLLGEIQKTGLFLNEGGSVGTVQHIDLAV